MSDEFTIAGNFQRFSDDPRAEAEYWYRMGRIREREADATTDPEHKPATCEERSDA